MSRTARIIAAVLVFSACVGTGLVVWRAVLDKRDTGHDRPRSAQGIQALTWAPPHGSTFTRIRVDEPGTVRMDDTRDYVIEAPAVIDGPVVLRGGGDVVWMGGHIQMDDQGATARPTERRALVVQDGSDPTDGRVVHIEGLLIDGSDLSEGIDVNAPSAVLQLQNIRVMGVHFRDDDDYEGTGAYEAPNHPDVVQTWGSVGELRVDGLTATSAYQGLFLVADQNQPHGPVKLRRVDLTAVGSTSRDGERVFGHRLFYWSREGSGPIRVDSGTVWIAFHPKSQWGPGLGDNVHYPSSAPTPYAASVDQDEQGTFVTWSTKAKTSRGEPAIRDLRTGGAGRIYGGSPPEGPFVPAGVPGIGYVSPGYASRSAAAGPQGPG